MSRDFLSSQIRTGNIIANNSNNIPKLIIYPDEYALDNNGTKSAGLSSYLSNPQNFHKKHCYLFMDQKH